MTLGVRLFSVKPIQRVQDTDLPRVTEIQCPIVCPPESDYDARIEKSA